MQKAGRRAQIHDAKLRGKDGRRAHISSVGRKLLNEIHPWKHAKIYKIMPPIIFKVI